MCWWWVAARLGACWRRGYVVRRAWRTCAASGAYSRGTTFARRHACRRYHGERRRADRRRARHPRGWPRLPADQRRPAEPAYRSHPVRGGRSYRAHASASASRPRLAGKDRRPRGRSCAQTGPEGILADGSADLVGMVRALIADPDLPNKIRTGRAGDVRMCLGLSECHHIGPHRTPLTCAVNAAAAREDEMEIVPAARPKTVVVVGAGQERCRISVIIVLNPQGISQGLHPSPDNCPCRMQSPDG